MSQQTQSNALDASRAGLYKSLLRKMLLIRRFEERAAEAYALGSIGGFCHLYIGQEAVAVGAIAAMQDDDVLMASYRDHAHALTRGISSREVMAELFGKVTGASRGKGGSMHIFDSSKGFLGGHAIVGGHIPLATGAAFGFKYRESGQVCVCFFGEAAVNNGAFHEALNMAAIWKLPVVYICENNRYGMGTALERASALYDVSQRGSSYEMPSEWVDGMDVLAMLHATERAIEQAREESIPTLLEARTYRFMGHSMSDPIHGHYRTQEEVEENKKRDPLLIFPKLLQDEGLMTDAEFEQMSEEVKDELDDAVKFAEESESPSPEELETDVYVD